MLDQLWAIWRDYQSGACGARRSWNETRYWIDQHCVDADDMAFEMGVLMRDYLVSMEFA
jgi:hypothetical protein